MSAARNESSEDTVGTIVEVLPQGLFRVQVADGRSLLAHIAASMRMTYVRVLPGDRVALDVSPYDRSRAVIVRRLP